MYSAILFLPLIGALVAGLFGRVIGHRGAEIVTTALLLLTALLSWIAFFDVAIGGYTDEVHVLRWIDSGALEVDWMIRVDFLTAVMLVVVTSVSSLVHVYSIGYMSHDPHRARFFAYLSLFTFAMLMLVTANNFVQLFFGWEGVGLASYLLIGFWYKKPSANAAAMKAFVVNRVGDFGLILGLAGIFMVFGSLDFDTVFELVPTVAGQTFHFAGMQLDIMTTICLLLFMGAMGKSAQFLLHTWLPDAMEGPTPVSALIHAATMVTAGVFLVARTSPMFEFAPDALWVVTLVGATTAFFAATVGLVQNDIKRVIAYSTCSQLGYMFVALGLGAYQIAIFHLFTHAFFKALLFLGSGSVIHAMSDEQDMRKMGGLYKMIPGTWIMMIIGTLGLTGFPYLAGYFSKDAIIEAAYMANTELAGYAFAMTVIAALMTSFYSWRLIFMTFHGESRASNDVISHVHESPWVMLIPLIVLSIGTVLAGFPFTEFFIGHHQDEFWNGVVLNQTDIMETFHNAPAWVVWSPFVMMALGFATAWLFYIARPDIPKNLAREQQPLYQFLLNKWYFDELYNLIFVRPAMWLGNFLWKRGDGFVIDGFGPNGIAARVMDITRNVVKLQTGYVYHYAFAMLIGVAAFITYYSLMGAN
ncbi:NADH-quinone oxidoreductase subunit L [Pyruvatibacter sp.]|uniref:NADH-quinone oxidoreductase subunit L n=1 Tax=Pyruvatibacter sp. TaxID=1981328 RepID=UPI0032633DBE